MLIQPDVHKDSIPLDLDSWKPLEKFIQTYPHFDENQIRWLLRFRNTNGLDKAVRKIGKKIYLNDALFSLWIMEKEG